MYSYGDIKLTFNSKTLKLLFLTVACLFVFTGVSCDFASDVVDDSVGDGLDGDMNVSVNCESYDELFSSASNCGNLGSSASDVADVDDLVFDENFVEAFESDAKIFNLNFVNSMPGEKSLAMDSVNDSFNNPSCFADAATDDCEDGLIEDTLFADCSRCISGLIYVVDSNGSLGNSIFREYVSQFSCETEYFDRNRKAYSADVVYNYDCLTLIETFDDENQEAYSSALEYSLGDTGSLVDYGITYVDDVCNDSCPENAVQDVAAETIDYVLTFTSNCGYYAPVVGNIDAEQSKEIITSNFTLTGSSLQDNLSLTLASNVEGTYTVCSNSSSDLTSPALGEIDEKAILNEINTFFGDYCIDFSDVVLEDLNSQQIIDVYADGKLIPTLKLLIFKNHISDKFFAEINHACILENDFYGVNSFSETIFLQNLFLTKSSVFGGIDKL